MILLRHANVFLPIVQDIANNVRKGRELQYSEGAIGITSLLQCPLKTKLSKQFDVQLDVTSVDIDDGFLWEQQVKTALRERFPENFVEEFVLAYTVDDIKIEGHLDVLLSFDKFVIGLELKAPRYLLLRKPITDKDIIGDNLVYGNGLVYMTDTYITQSKIQHYLLKKTFPDKTVYTYIFAKTLLVYGSYMRKFYVVYDTSNEVLSDDEFKTIIESFRNGEGPTFAFECMMCRLFELGLCDGKPYDPIEQQLKDLDKDTQALIREYIELEARKKLIEKELKKRLRGSVKINNRKVIGWVKKEQKRVDIDKLIEQVSKHELKRYIAVRPDAVDIIQRKYPDTVTVTQEVKWQG